MMINCVWYLLYGLLNRATLLDLAHHIGLDFIVITLIVILILKMKTEIVSFKLQVNANGFGMSYELWPRKFQFSLIVSFYNFDL